MELMVSCRQKKRVHQCEKEADDEKKKRQQKQRDLLIFLAIPLCSALMCAGCLQWRQAFGLFVFNRAHGTEVTVGKQLHMTNHIMLSHYGV